MKKTILAMVISLMTSSLASAQNNNRPSREQMQQIRAERLEKHINSLSEKMELNTEQKEKFTVLYKQMAEEMGKSRRGLRPQMPNQPEQKEKKEITEKEAQERLQKKFEHWEQDLSRQQEILNIQKKYCQQMADFLNAKQLLKVFPRREEQNSRPGFNQRGKGQQRGTHNGSKHDQSRSENRK